AHEPRASWHAEEPELLHAPVLPHLPGVLPRPDARPLLVYATPPAGRQVHHGRRRLRMARRPGRGVEELRLPEQLPHPAGTAEHHDVGLVAVPRGALLSDAAAASLADLPVPQDRRAVR